MIKWKSRYLQFSCQCIVMLLGWITTLSQCKITGYVMDMDHVPIAGVTVSVKKNTQFGSMTDTSGIFNVTATRGSTLIFSSVGYRSFEFLVLNDTVLRVTLKISMANLDEMVVMGYSRQKVKEITGSVAVVKPEDLVSIPAGQFEQMLQGRVAGLNVITSGEPGSASNVRLHGIGNFGDVTPLYIIDGVQGDINSINPYDIESIQVLKDAGAYSIYGVRGANGVILITTQKGKTGKTIFNYSGYVGLQEPLSKNIDLLNPILSSELEWLASKNSGIPNSDPIFGNGLYPVIPDVLVNNSKAISTHAFRDSVVNADLNNVDSAKGAFYQIIPFNTAGTDWFHQLFKPAFSQNHLISASGGNEKSRYYFSLGYLDQEGTLVNTFLKRFTIRVNTEFSAKKNIHFGENLQLSYSENPKSQKPDPSVNIKTGDISSAILGNPYQSVYDVDGNYSSLITSNPSPEDNPLGRRELSKNDQNDSWQVFGNLYAELNFLNHFTARTSFGGQFNFFNSYNFTFGSYNSVDSSGSPNQFYENTGYLSSWTWNNTISYGNIFGGKHQINVLAGIENVNNYSRNQFGTKQGLIITSSYYRFLSNGEDDKNSGIAFTSYLASIFFSANYAFREKYLLTAIVRRDGSSVFGDENRYGWFPAFSIAWRMTQENAFKTSPWLSDLKLRVSWGETGFNGNTSPLNQFNLFNTNLNETYYDLLGTSNSAVRGFRQVNIGNQKTGWQKDQITNVGMDGIFWEGKLYLTADWYIKRSNGLLIPASLPALLGVATPPNVNVGEIENKGIDILVGSKGNFSKSWGWDLTFTFTTYHNNIVRLNGLPYIDYSNSLYTGGVRNAVGHPVGSYFGYQITGYFQDNDDVAKSPKQESAAPGRFKYKDVNHDGVISSDDETFIGNPNPDFTGGLNMGLYFYHFDFSAFFFGSYGNDVLNELRWKTDIYTSPEDIGSHTSLYEAWWPGRLNPKAPIVEMTQDNFSTKGVPNSYPIEKGSYFRNKSLMLGYSFSRNILQKLRINNMRIYVQAINLFTITHYSGLDPELSGLSKAWGFDEGNYPNNQKQYLVGINMSF